MILTQDWKLTDLWRHPVRRSDECVPPADGSVQLGADPEVDQLHLSVVRQQNVLAFNITMDHFARVQVG